MGKKTKTPGVNAGKYLPQCEPRGGESQKSPVCTVFHSETKALSPWEKGTEYYGPGTVEDAGKE